jgi:hypothetical protein
MIVLNRNSIGSGIFRPPSGLYLLNSIRHFCKMGVVTLARRRLLGPLGCNSKRDLLHRLTCCLDGTIESRAFAYLGMNSVTFVVNKFAGNGNSTYI